MSAARLADAFAHQAGACAALGSPFMARLCTALPALLPAALRARLEAWPGDLGPRGASVPLRLCGALHALRLQGRAGLDTLYPPQSPDDAAFANGIAAALTDEAEFIAHFIDLPPQTNEIRRSAALIAGACLLAARRPLPFILSELGASAGLNLGFAAHRLDGPGWQRGAAASPVVLTPDWQGAAPPEAELRLIEARGVDLSPFDPVAGHIRLLAYLWADQPQRRVLTEAAMTLSRAPVDAGDAAPWLESRLAAPRRGAWHLVTHTIAAQYFSAQARARVETALTEAGRRATPEAPVAHLAMEADDESRGAGLSLRLWPGGAHGLCEPGEHWQLGRVDFHGRWLDWTPRRRG